jgi:hypothetical protein
MSPELQAVYRRFAARERVTREKLFRHVLTATVREIPDASGCAHPVATVRAWRRQGLIFAFRHHARDYFPLFQFECGTPKPIVDQVLRLVCPDDGWHALYWFEGANGWLEGMSPVDVMDSDPSAVLKAARHANDEISD